MNKNLKEQIIKLRFEGKNYNQIKELLGCSKSTIGYHLDPEQKRRSRERHRKFKSRQHPLYSKINHFNDIKLHNKKTRNYKSTAMQRLYWKLKRFNDGKVVNMITIEQALEKFGDSPTCYISGTPIDLTKTQTYELDHIVPRSRGGSNSIDNMGLVTKDINQAKRAMTDKEFIALCKMVAEHNK